MFDCYVDIKPIPGVTIVSNADVLQAETLTKTMAAMAPFVQADVILRCTDRPTDDCFTLVTSL